MRGRPISREQARLFYDRFGAQQDRQGWYEDAAIERLVEAAGFSAAWSVVELGCGTGRLAARLLAEEMPASARYLGIETSSTMAELSRRRLAPFGERAAVVLQRDDGPLSVVRKGCDRLVSTYVLDLLADQEITAVLAWAAAVVLAGGRICLAGLTHGSGAISRLVMAVWTTAFRLAPLRVGGCRPMRIAERLDRTLWEIELEDVVVSWGIASEVLVARRLESPAPSGEPS